MLVNGELFALVNTLANGLSLWLAARLLGGPLPERPRTAIPEPAVRHESSAMRFA
jgi:hypothetical protein